MQRLGAGEGRPQVHLTRHVRDPAVSLDRVGLAVDPEDLGPPRRLTDQPQQQPDRRRLAGAVGPEVADHLTLGHLEVEGYQSLGVPERLRQVLGAYRRHRRRHDPSLLSEIGRSAHSDSGVPPPGLWSAAVAVLGKGHSQSAGGRWRRRAIGAGVAAFVLFAVNTWPAKASQDPMFPVQWNLQQIGAPDAWARSTGAGVRIGIVDSGVFAGQEDLAGKVVTATDCIGTAGDPDRCHGSGQDDTGHGTHMAGVAAARKDNGRGIAGVAPDAQLVVARVLTNDGGSILDVEAGIRWVVRHGAQVVNLSVADN